MHHCFDTYYPQKVNQKVNQYAPKRNVCVCPNTMTTSGRIATWSSTTMSTTSSSNLTTSSNIITTNMHMQVPQYEWVP